MNRAVRGALFAPTAIAVALGITVFTSLFTPGGRLEDMAFAARLAVNGLNFAIYFVATATFMGGYLASLLTRGWPWIWGIVPFYLPLAMLTGLIDSTVMPSAMDWRVFLWSFGTTCAMVLIAATMVSLMFQEPIKQKLTVIGRRDEFARPNWTATAPGETPQVPDALRGRVQVLRAANQYVEVTTPAQTELVRMALKDAEALLDPVLGGHVHRSAWIAWDFVEDVRREDGKLLLIAKDGRELPVSRSNVKVVLETLRAKGLDC